MNINLTESSLEEMFNKIKVAGIKNLVMVAAPKSLSDVLCPMGLVDGIDYSQSGDQLSLISHKAQSMSAKIRNTVGADA